jgi:NodT family efflux transporter outer membrane factor (OMF) lipoprotein
MTADAPTDEWWAAFGDEKLTQLIVAALRDNPDLAAAEAQVRRGRAAASVAGAAGRPSVNALARVADDKLSRNGENLALMPFSPATTEFTDYRVGLDASWEIDLAGRTRREIEAATARFGSAVESRNDARVVIASEVAATYIDLRLAQARLGIARDRAVSAAEVRRLVGLQRQAGAVGDDQLLRAEADSASAAGGVAPLEAAADAALFALAALTGEGVERLRAHIQPTAEVPCVDGVVPVGLAANVLRRRPDVRRAERDLAAATADVGGAVAAQFPRLSLVAVGGLDSIRSGDLGAAASRYWTVAPQLTAPLFAGGRLRGQVRMAEAGRDAALGHYRATVLRALADAESSIVRLAGARIRQRNIDAAASAFQAAVRSAQLREHAGESSRVDVLLATRAADDARELDVVAAADSARAFVALQRALGGGWQSAATSRIP